MSEILITGAGSGLGRELAIEYAKKNNQIILIGRTMKTLEITAKKVEKIGSVADIYLCDISNISSIEKMISDVVEKYKKIDCLINNAGIGYFGALEEISLDEINTMIDINVKGTILVTKKLLPYINEKIINIISTAGLRGKVNESVYVASKFAIRGFTESLQKEFNDNDISIISVYMGGMDTPFWDNSNHIKDRSKLMSPSKIAKEIVCSADKTKKIVIERD